MLYTCQDPIPGCSRSVQVHKDMAGRLGPGLSGWRLGSVNIFIEVIDVKSGSHIASGSSQVMDAGLELCVFWPPAPHVQYPTALESEVGLAHVCAARRGMSRIHQSSSKSAPAGSWRRRGSSRHRSRKSMSCRYNGVYESRLYHGTPQ